jgi:peptidyl-prolyl cis-trans isomerase A (cyclophilin A)
MKKMLLLCTFLLKIPVFAQAPDPAILQVKAPEIFKALFKTNKGEFVIEANRKWSPLGVDRLYQLIKTGFFTNALFFRVEQNFVVQFGISASYPANRFWDPRKLPDEPAIYRNIKGMISFARGGSNNRATQLFVNMADNPKLDTTTRGGVKGYTPVAKVIKGMEALALLNQQYGKKPAAVQDSLYKYGNGYFEKQFPGLDKILSATVIK